MLEFTRQTGKLMFALRQKLNSLMINCTRQHSADAQSYDVKACLKLAFLYAK